MGRLSSFPIIVDLSANKISNSVPITIMILYKIRLSDKGSKYNKGQAKKAIPITQNISLQYHCL